MVVLTLFFKILMGGIYIATDTGFSWIKPFLYTYTYKAVIPHIEVKVYNKCYCTQKLAK